MGVLVGLFIFALYWLPTAVAVTRKVPNVGSVGVINLFLGWTLVGWVIALAMASRSNPAALDVQINTSVTTGKED